VHKGEGNYEEATPNSFVFRQRLIDVSDNGTERWRVHAAATGNDE